MLRTLRLSRIPLFIRHHLYPNTYLPLYLVHPIRVRTPSHPYTLNKHHLVIHTIPATTLQVLAPYTAAIIPSATYLADPLNGYTHLGMAKLQVKLVGGGWGVGLDTRVLTKRCGAAHHLWLNEAGGEYERDADTAQGRVCEGGFGWLCRFRRWWSTTNGER